MIGHMDDGEPLQFGESKFLQGKDSRLKTNIKALTDVHYKNRFFCESRYDLKNEKKFEKNLTYQMLQVKGR